MITFQLDSTSPLVSVFYRFLISSAILFIACKTLRVPLTFKPRHHLWFAGQGICMFSVNYILTYIAEGMVTSGLIAVTFTLLLYYNILGTWLILKIPLRRNVVVGALVGGLGIGLIFLQEILNFQPGSRAIWGLLIGAIATVFASAGNLISYVHHKGKIPVMASNTLGMFYGSCFSLFLALLFGVSFATEWTPKFIWSLLYLSVFGSVIAFGAYISLIGRIGAERAAYSSVINPVIALTLSSFFEGFQWTPEIGIGVGLCLLGNVITLHKPKKKVIPV